MFDIHHPHDSFFKASMRNRRVAIDFFHAHLPVDILQRMDFDTLKLESASFVDNELKEYHSDMIYGVRIDQAQSYIYILVEHQRSSEKLMPYRVHRYMGKLMDWHINDNDTEQLPVIIPMIFYNGERPYHHSTDIFSLFGENEQLARQCYMAPLTLIDLNEIEDVELRKHRWASLMSVLMKHRASLEILDVIRLLSEEVKAIWSEGGTEYIENAIYYVLGMGGENIKLCDRIIDAFAEIDLEIGEATMNLAELLVQKGLKKGLKKGRDERSYEIMQSLQEQGVDPDIIQRACSQVQKEPLAWK